MADYPVIMRDLPEEERPRERLAKHGPAGLSNAELIAILLRVGARGQSAVALAERLLSEFRGLEGVAGASVERLSQVKGMGLAKAAQLQSAFELGKRLATEPQEKRPVVRGPHDAAKLIMEDLRYKKKEHFVVLHLDVRNRVLKTSTVSIGSLTANIAHPREVFREAVDSGAAHVIVAHNHPSGDPTPSKEDKALTKRLKETGEILGITLLDHLIIGAGEFVSLKEKGLL
jgi:DNA repair protein RadC